MSDKPEWIDREAALSSLGVKTQTLYAYVSRGRIAARPDPDNPRRSLYAASDIQRLKSGEGGPSPVAIRGSSGAARGEALVESQITLISPDGPVYRGEKAIDMARRATLEQTSRILWGAFDEDPFANQRPRVDVIFPGTARQRLFAALARRADEDASSRGRGARSLQREAASILNEMADALVGTGPRLHIHQRLARGWKMIERDADLVRHALVLGADHELDSSVLAARVVAGSGASLSAAALAGLSAFSGPENGGALSQVSTFVNDARRDARAAVRAHLGETGQVPGFGSNLYAEGDPRARALIEAARLPDDLRRIIEVGETMTGTSANFKLALALVARKLEIPRDGAFALAACARLSGWLAHGMDQALSGSPLRARLRYVGETPSR